jgi:DNA-directed RNA polymerase specialized sigma24 family protein
MAIEMLPDICRQVLLLRDVEEFNVTDTAQILNINPSSVKASLHQARMTLQSFLASNLGAITNASAYRGEPHD